MKRLKKFLIALTSLFSVVALFPLSACSGGKMHTLTMINECEEGGTLNGEGSYKTGSQVTISYSANKGYKFDKWDIDGETIKISNRTYTFKMPNKDITVKGSFIPKKYEVRVHQSYNAEVIGEGTYDYNSEVTLTCIPDTGYRFLNWYEEDKGTVLSTEQIYTFKMPAKDIVINADTEMAEYNVTLVCNDPYHADVFLSSNYLYYNYSYTVQVSYKNLSNNEYYAIKALYLYNDGTKGELISNNATFVMPARDCTIYVEIERTYRVSFTGVESIGYNTYNFVNTKYTLSCIESKTLEFIGWFDDKGTLLSKEHIYDYYTVDYDTDITGRYNYDCGVSFGEYPQDLVIDNDLMDELDKIDTVNSKGYIEYQGEQYYKTGVSRISMVCLNSTQEKYQDFTYRARYYKVKPILWQIMHKVPNTDLTLLMSKYILNYKTSEEELSADTYCYKDSAARAYLNGEFFNNSFSELEKSKIETVAVDALDTINVVDKDTYQGDYYYEKVLIPGAADSLYTNPNNFNYLKDEIYFYNFLTYGFSTDLATGTSNSYNTIYQHSFIKNFSLSTSLVRDAYNKTYNFSVYGQINETKNRRISTYIRPMIFVKGL